MKKIAFLYFPIISIFLAGPIQAKTQETAINISAEVIAETCSALVNETSQIVIDFGQISLKDFANASQVVASSKPTPIKFTCSTGEYANFKISPITSELCGGPSEGSVLSQRHSCAGKNKTIATAPSFKWTNKSGAIETINGFGSHPVHIAARTIKLNPVNQKKEGTITIDTVSFIKLQEIVPTPGPIAGNFIITMWEN